MGMHMSIQCHKAFNTSFPCEIITFKYCNYEPIGKATL